MTVREIPCRYAKRNCTRYAELDGLARWSAPGVCRCANRGEDLILMFAPGVRCVAPCCAIWPISAEHVRMLTTVPQTVIRVCL